MELKARRLIFTPESSIGDFYVNDGLFCFCLEDTVREKTDQSVEKWKIDGKTAIPVGRYRVIIDFSNRFQRQMMHLLNVPGFTGVRIHAGNTSLDTEGCILVGTTKLQNQILDSRVAEKKLFTAVNAAILRGEQVTITVEGLPNVS